MDTCPKCGETENFHYNYDFTKANSPIIDILCNNCGELFPPVLKLPKETPKQETLEEAAEKYVEDFDLSFYDTVEEIPVKELGKKDFKEGAKSDAAKDYWYAKWQQQDSGKDTADYIDKNLVQALVEIGKQNSTVYSEKDVREAFRQGMDNMDYSEMYGWSSKLTEQQWFENFKKTK